jgi:HAD superfamily hydrolase (TIGR01509 family)
MAKTDSLRAILFDFDGVIADTEPIHLEMFQAVLKKEGIDLTEEDYFGKYLGLNDFDCFAAVFKDHGKVLTPGKRDFLVAKKHDRFIDFVKGKSLLLPGVSEFIAKVADQYYLAIVSGALKKEIQLLLQGAGLEKKFHLIVAADDVAQGKPHPEGFLAAVRLLNRDFIPPSEILLAKECLAIEDSPWGIDAAHEAGNKCLAVLTSYPAERLSAADLITPNLRTVDWKKVEALF